MQKSIKKYLLILLGSLALVLGMIGIFMPILPTTPFLLLASYCYLRSSARLYHWLTHHKFLGPYLHNYITHRAIPKSTKIGALLFLWCSLGVSIVLVQNLHVTILLLLVGIGVSIHLFTLKSISKEEFTKRAVCEENEKP